jgi:hypothetical protein
VIFISIAAYRDPQLVPTIEDCLRHARHPEDLRFGICWQHGPEEDALPFAGDPRFRILDVDWRESRGACWARAAIMKLYRGEDWFLQLDSHHRFVPDWDVRLIEQAARTGSAKPVITTYATPFNPEAPDDKSDEPMQMNIDRFTPDAVILFRPGGIADWKNRPTPVRARFLSAHLLFAPGTFVHDVPYDPDLYFIGEEITLAVRAFTHGYDLFHITETVVWHEYTREYREHKHWSDHRKANGVEVEWYDRDRASLDKVRRFLEEPHVGPFGCGTARTFAEYEAYAGVNFRRRRSQDYTRRFLEPPNPPMPADWADRIGSYEIEIAIEKSTLPAHVDDYLFWYVGFHDVNDQEIHRLDADKDDVKAMLAGPGEHAILRRSFESEREPVSWTVWPNSVSKGWLDKLQGPTLSADPDVTFVTALLDIGRDRLGSMFARSFSAHYLPQFVRLLKVDVPMVVYVQPEYEPLVWRHRRRDNTRVIPLRPADLESAPWFNRVQDIRARPAWRQQAAWLAESPQACLPHYNPLVFSKMLWLDRAAAENPFASSHLFWIDAGILNTVPEELVAHKALAARLVNASGDFLFAAYPYAGAEIHGFPRPALARAAGVADVGHVMRGGFFGGRADAIPTVAADYRTLLTETLGAGMMGTEESLFTILAHRQPDRFACYSLAENGLLSPLFDALVNGNAADQRMQIERQLPPVEPPAPRAVFSPPPDVPDEARTGVSQYMGMSMMQNRYAVDAYQALFRHLSAERRTPARVIELGTGMGALSALLKTYCAAVEAEFITYDRAESVAANPRLLELGIHVRVKDIEHEFVIREIARELQKDGLTILICDGPDKAAEVQLFSPYLKTGDLILAHDYAPSREFFDEHIKGKLWSWCEVTDDQLAGVSRDQSLEPLLESVFIPAVWTCRIKRGLHVTHATPAPEGDDTIGVYVLTFNAPAQFRNWLESVMRAEPSLLTTTDKVLLNNSTDESTLAEYDALCAEHGFRQYRLGNIGINPGRLWCARHFYEETRHAAMIYFEDDMLLYEAPGVCRNGLPTRVPQLLSRSYDILRNEPGLDFLKLSFTEFFGDHRENWTYYNMSQAQRTESFPDGHATRIDAIKSYAGVSYVRGEIFYSNWPMLMTRRGAHTMFLRDENILLYEQSLMVRGFELARRGELRGAVLLASPVNHDRQHHYPADVRKEC